MGEISEMMLTGILCAGCGQSLDCFECEKLHMPIYCDRECAEDHDAIGCHGGTCPDQLLDKIHEVKKKLGHTPSLKQFMKETGGQRYKHLIIATFGSWLNALRLAGLQPKEKELYHDYRRYTKEELLEHLRIFAQEHRKRPTESDFIRGLLPTTTTYLRHFGSIKEARRLADIEQFYE